jgi:small-conductance mechanosensitive channel
MGFLGSHLASFVGLAAFLVALVARAITRTDDLKKDLGRSAVWFGVFLALRLSGMAAEEHLPAEWHPYLRVSWMLAFAYGAVRLTVTGAFELRRRLRIGPSLKILRDVTDFVLYVLVTIPVLRTQLKLDVTTLLGTSAVLSLVLGFALQDTLGNVFAGLSLQMERPFQVGDFVRVGLHQGRVLEISWRSTLLETPRREIITVPNAMIAKEAVTNFSRGGQSVGIDLHVGTAFDAPPNLVKAEILDALSTVTAIAAVPPPFCGVAEFGDSAIKYLVRVHLDDFGALPLAQDAIYSRLWYRFGRANIEIPYPQRVVTTKKEHGLRAAPGVEMLEGLELFAPFTADERHAIAQRAKERTFGAGEAIIVEGREGDTFYVVVQGSVVVRAGTPPAELARLGRGQGFGEMAVLTGEKRSATVVAAEDCHLLELDREVFARHFAEHPERARDLAALLERRRAELAALPGPETPGSPRDARSIFARLKVLFRLKET